MNTLTYFRSRKVLFKKILIAACTVVLTAQMSVSRATEPALEPAFGSVIRTDGGFSVDIVNFNPEYSWTVLSSVGSVEILSGTVIVTGLSAGQTADVTVTTDRFDYDTGTNSVSGAALDAALTPTFGLATRTIGGFTVEITNYDASFTWSASSNEGSASIDGFNVLAVSGLLDGQSSTVYVTASRAGYLEGLSEISGTALDSALSPSFGDVISTADGFTVAVTNYDAAYSWSAQADSGEASIDSFGQVSVTGLSPDQNATVTVTTTRDGYVDGSSSVLGSSLYSSFTPSFDGVISTADGFTVGVTNFDAAYSWSAQADSGDATIDSFGQVTVTGLSVAQTATVTVTTSREGYVDGSGEVTGTSLDSALTPTFGPVTRTSGGFTAEITNYDASFTWSASSNEGSVSIDGFNVVNITGLLDGQDATVNVTTSRAGYATGSSFILGSSLNSPLTPSFGASVSTADGFTVAVTNYDADYTWSAEVTAGYVNINSSGLVTVTGLSSEQSATVTVTTFRVGHVDGSANVAGAAGSSSEPYEVALSAFTPNARELNFGYLATNSESTLMLSRSGGSGSYPTTTLSATGTGTWLIQAGTGTSLSSSTLTSAQPVTITLTGPSGSLTLKLSAGASAGSHVVTVGTTPVATYFVTVKAVSPGAVSSIKAKSSRKSKATISWSTPVSNGGSAITRYEIRMVRKGKKTIVKYTTKTSITVSKLARKKSYKVLVSACNAVGCSPTSSVRVKIK